MEDFFVDATQIFSAVSEFLTDVAMQAFSVAGIFLAFATGLLVAYFTSSLHAKVEKLREQRSNLLAAVLEAHKLYAWGEKVAIYYSHCSREDLFSLSTPVDFYPSETIRAITRMYFYKTEIHEQANVLAEVAFSYQIKVRGIARIRIERGTFIDKGTGRVNFNPDLVVMTKDLQDLQVAEFKKLLVVRDRFVQVADDRMKVLLGEKTANPSTTPKCPT